MNAEVRQQLEKTAARVRLGILEGVYHAGCGHPGGSLSAADVLTYLYFREMRIDPARPDDPDRDRFVLSKGHSAPALYSVLAERGYFPKEDLATLRKPDSYLQGHPDMKHTPGVDMSAGSLGLGISAACGMALAGKLSGKDYRVYCMIGDGESEEGQVWEAAMFAHHYKLDNLCVILDLNGLQIDGPTRDVIDPAPHDKKLEAFGWHVFPCDGHDFDSIETAFRKAEEARDGQPSFIIANTVKGKGISYMENACGWHGKAPNEDEYRQALAELRAML